MLAATDLHVDYAENMEWYKRLDSQAHRRDVLAVSGDVSDELGALEEALGCLASKFGAVFYTPGNHELWIRERDRWGCLPGVRRAHSRRHSFHGPSPTAPLLTTRCWQGRRHHGLAC